MLGWSFGIAFENSSKPFLCIMFKRTRLHLELSLNSKEGNIHILFLTYDEEISLPLLNLRKYKKS